MHTIYKSTRERLRRCIAMIYIEYPKNRVQPVLDDILKEIGSVYIKTNHGLVVETGLNSWSKIKS